MRLLATATRAVGEYAFATGVVFAAIAAIQLGLDQASDESAATRPIDV
jgi:hypothetical protein